MPNELIFLLNKLFSILKDGEKGEGGLNDLAGGGWGVCV